MALFLRRNAASKNTPVKTGYRVGLTALTYTMPRVGVTAVESGQTTDALIFKFGVSASGATNASDLSAVKARSGLAWSHWKHQPPALARLLRLNTAEQPAKWRSAPSCPRNPVDGALQHCFRGAKLCARPPSNGVRLCAEFPFIDLNQALNCCR